MITLTKDQELDLVRTATSLFGTVKFVAIAGTSDDPSRSALVASASGYVMGSAPCWDGFSNTVPAHLRVALQAFYREMEPGNVDRHGALERGYEHVLSSLRCVISAPGETGTLLANMHGLEAGQPWAQLRHFVDAGVALEELRGLDPNFSIVAPGVEALYKKWGPWLGATHADVDEVLVAIKSTVGRVFVEQ